jgi:hypothetical protein
LPFIELPNHEEGRTKEKENESIEQSSFYSHLCADLKDEHEKYNDGHD